MDLRFIPEEETFDEKARDLCDTVPDVSQYEPRIFLTSALQQAQVQLTWDETNPDRLVAMQRLFQVDFPLFFIQSFNLPMFNDKKLLLTILKI